MGFSTSGATVVLFVGLLVALGVLVPTVQDATERVSGATADRADRQLRTENTAVEIASTSFDAGNLTVEVDNVGAEALVANDTDLLVDGAYVRPDSSAVEGEPNRSTWAPGERLTLNVTDYGGDPDRVKVVAETGVAALETGV